MRQKKELISNNLLNKIAKIEEDIDPEIAAVTLQKERKHKRRKKINLMKEKDEQRCKQNS